MDIYRFHPTVLFYWLVAFSVWEWLFNVSIMKVSESTSTIGEYYTKLPSWVVVSGDFLYSTLIFLAAQWVFPFVQGWLPTLPPLAVFAVTFVAMQWIFDLTYGFTVSQLPSTTSRYVDFFQRYIKEFGFMTVIGDSFYLLVWLAITWLLLTYIPLSVALFILIAAVFLWLVVKY
jgi:hypothetical protein